MCTAPDYHTRAARAAGLLLAILLAASVLAGQRDDPRAVIRSTTTLIVVPVTVKDNRGQAVLDVRREEFRVLEDDVEQEIELFSNDPFPLSAVVLLDNDLPQKSAENVQTSAGAIAGGFSAFDEVAISRFDTVYRNVAEFTTDNDRLFEALQRVEVDGSFPGQGSAPMTSPPRVNTSPIGPGVPSTGMKAARSEKHLNDALFEAAQLLRTRGRDRRKIIFVVSDGVNGKNNTYSYDDTVRQLLSADISVYAVGVGEALRARALGPLARYARATGGDVFYGNSRAELESAYRNVTEQARNQYTLAYTPRGTNRQEEYHSIEVRVRRRGLTLLAREGYFAPAAP